jgi:polar amino acid transport system substrate-binding protein
MAVLITAALILLLSPTARLSFAADGAATGDSSASNSSANTTAGSSGITRIADMANKRVGMVEGTIFDKMVTERFPTAQKMYYKNQGDLVGALLSGQIDCFLVNTITVDDVRRGVPQVKALEETFSEESYGFIFPQGSDELRAEFNTAIAKLWEDGTIDMAREKWMDEQGEQTLPDVPQTGENGILNVALDPEKTPFAFTKDGAYAGYDVEVMAHIAKELGYGIEFAGMSFGGVLPAIASGKYDLAAAGIAITEERAESVDFTDPYFFGTTSLVVLDSTAQSDSFLTSLKTSFNKTFVDEGRSQLIIDGLLTTLLITALSIVFGSLLGLPFCLASRSRFSPLRLLTVYFLRFLEMIPTVVLLLVLAYVVFAKMSLSVVAVSVVCFTLIFATYASYLYNLGIDSVDKGQIEASEALGFSKLQTISLIVFPQAAHHVFGSYISQIINILKLTAIVGYIAVADLTKASDIIRSRTFEAFFPLITTAIIYIIIAWLITVALNRVNYKLDPFRRKRTIKGVTR